MYQMNVYFNLKCGEVPELETWAVGFSLKESDLQAVPEAVKEATLVMKYCLCVSCIWFTALTGLDPC